MKDYLLLILSALLLAVVFALNKLYQRKAGTSLEAGFRFNIAIGLLTSLIFLVIGGFQLKVTPFSVLMALGVSALCMSYTLIGFRILKAGSMAMYSLFLMVGGMTVPYIWGLLFLDEPFSIMRTIGLCLLIGAVIISNLGNRSAGLKLPVILMCIAVFFLNGFVSVLSKMHQISTTFEAVSSTDFVIISGLAKCAIGAVALIVCALLKRGKHEVKENKEAQGAPRMSRSILLNLIPIFVLVAAADGISYFLQLAGAAKLPASALYPFVTGGSMIFSTIVGIIAFKEKPSKMTIISICICFIGTLMFL